MPERGALRGKAPSRKPLGRLEDLIEDIPAGVVNVDIRGRITYANKTVLEYTGYKWEELAGKNAFTSGLFGRETVKVLRDRLKEKLMGGPPSPLEVEFRCKDGSRMWLDIRGKALREKGLPVGVQIVGQEITQRKKAEHELRRSREELRRLAAHLQLLREEERADVAWELHDELGQALAALNMDLRWLEARMPQDRAELLEKTQSMSQLLGTSIQRLRRLYTELRPGMLEHLGLAATIEWQAEEFQKRTGISSATNLEEGAAAASADCSLALYRVLQEALSNTARHARATEVVISLRTAGDDMVLEVTDNGRGITRKQLSAPESLGLIGMKERLRPWGGQVTISGMPRKGTTVRIAVPLKQANREAQPAAALPPATP